MRIIHATNPKRFSGREKTFPGAIRFFRYAERTLYPRVYHPRLHTEGANGDLVPGWGYFTHRGYAIRLPSPVFFPRPPYLPSSTYQLSAFPPFPFQLSTFFNPNIRFSVVPRIEYSTHIYCTLTTLKATCRIKPCNKVRCYIQQLTGHPAGHLQTRTISVNRGEQGVRAVPPPARPLLPRVLRRYKKINQGVN